MSSGGEHGSEVPVTFISEQQKWRWWRAHLWQSTASLVVGGAFRTAHQHQSTGLHCFQPVVSSTYWWDVSVVTVRTLCETVWFHRRQVSQQTRQHLYRRRSQTTNRLRVTDERRCHCTDVSSTNRSKLPHLSQRSDDCALCQNKANICLRVIPAIFSKIYTKTNNALNTDFEKITYQYRWYSEFWRTLKWLRPLFTFIRPNGSKEKIVKIIRKKWNEFSNTNMRK